MKRNYFFGIQHNILGKQAKANFLCETSCQANGDTEEIA
jgi:hypothetical protein